jgi:hypothetical protein
LGRNWWRVLGKAGVVLMINKGGGFYFVAWEAAADLDGPTGFGFGGKLFCFIKSG